MITQRPTFAVRWTYRRQVARNKGLTLIEALTAVTITLIFVGGVAAAFIQIVRAADEAEASVRAHSAARGAVDRIATDLRALQLDANRENRRLRLVNRPLAYGDNIDHDGSGSINPEHVDGRDTDGNWSPVDDRHAQIGPYFERPNFVGVPDLGDVSVDDNVRFSADEITWLEAGTNGQTWVGYRLDTFDGEPHVLVRTIRQGNNPEVVEPVVFDVVSLDILAWDANAEIRDFTNFEPIVPYWVEEWDSEILISDPDRFIPGVNPPFFPDGQPIVQVEPFYIPPSFYIRVTVNAEPSPLRDIPSSDWPQGNRSLRTVSVSTVVNVESVIQGQLYYDYIRE